MKIIWSVLIVIVMSIIFFTNNVNSVLADLTDNEWLKYNKLLDLKFDILEKHAIPNEFLNREGLLKTIFVFGLNEQESRILEKAMMYEIKKEMSVDPNSKCDDKIHEDFIALLACKAVEEKNKK